MDLHYEAYSFRHNKKYKYRSTFDIYKTQRTLYNASMIWKSDDQAMKTKQKQNFHGSNCRYWSDVLSSKFLRRMLLATRIKFMQLAFSQFGERLNRVRKMPAKRFYEYS